MGLFINSHLQAINMHKRLTELEKLSEISTGILALKNMVESGDDLQDRSHALENLSRILPMLSGTQQQYVLDEIFSPLAAELGVDHHFLNPSLEPDISEGVEHDMGASSDYEMEFQLTLKRQAHFLDLKQLNREQRDFRHDQELERQRAVREQVSQEQIEKARVKIHLQIDEHWNKLNLSDQPKRRILQLRQFLFRFSNGLGRDHPKIIEAVEAIRQL